MGTANLIGKKPVINQKLVETILGQFSVHQIDMLSEAIRANLDNLKL